VKKIKANTVMVFNDTFNNISAISGW